jgi:transcription elongation factor GreA
MSQIPLDRVGLGSRVVLSEEKTGTQETYSLVFGDSVEFEEGQVTMSSPIGRALLGKAVGDDVVLRLPSSSKRMKVVALATIHNSEL